MDLKTKYLGLDLANPIVAGSGPLATDLDACKRLAEAGVAAIVMNSLFEEQITREQLGTIMDMELHAESFAEALSYFPRPDEFRLGPETYLEQLAKVKAATGLPVIGSLNGTTPSGWLDFAKQIEQAGAAALELNIYHVATRPDTSGEAIEARMIEEVKAVKAAVRIPVAVKLSPFFSSISAFAARVDAAGANGLVLFNRFYQPDIDVEKLEAVPSLRLSDASELLLRLRWLAILSGQVKGSLAVSGGVHTALDAVKAILCGAGAVQMVSALLRHGPAYAATVIGELKAWFEEHEYASIAQARGSMGLDKCPNPEAFERANYMRVLQGWRG